MVGVPASVPVPSPLSVSVIHEGQLQVIAAESPASTSEVVIEYEYALSSSTAVTAVLEIEGASLVLATVIVKV